MKGSRSPARVNDKYDNGGAFPLGAPAGWLHPRAVPRKFINRLLFLLDSCSRKLLCSEVAPCTMIIPRCDYDLWLRCVKITFILSEANCSLDFRRFVRISQGGKERITPSNFVPCEIYGNSRFTLRTNPETDLFRDSRWNNLRRVRVCRRRSYILTNLFPAKFRQPLIPQLG